MKAILRPVKGSAAEKLDKIFAESKPSMGQKISRKQRRQFMNFMRNKWVQDQKNSDN